MAKVKAAEKSESKAKVVKKSAGLSVAVYDIKGTQSKEMALPKSVFAVSVPESLLAQALRVYQAGTRQGTAATKTRGSIVGSTRKIYRQKGTGRARHGSRKAPIFVGGGVVGGPQPKDHSLDLNKKQRQKAIIGALSLKAKEGQVIGLSETGIEKINKTKTVFQFLKALKLDGKRVTFVTSKALRLGFLKMASNIARIEVIDPASLNVFSVLNSRSLVFFESAVTELEKHLLKS